MVSARLASRVSVGAGRQLRQIDSTRAEEAAIHEQQAVKAAVGWQGEADPLYGVTSLGKVACLVSLEVEMSRSTCNAGKLRWCWQQSS